MDEKRLALIRYVSSHYGELQGLTDMAVAGVVAFIAAWALAFGWHWSVLLIGGVLAVVAGCSTRGYYSARFGRVRAPASETFLQKRPWLFGVVYAATIIWDQHHQGAGMPSTYFLSFSGFVLWQVISSWPFQVHRLVLFAAGLLASIMFTAVRDDAQVNEWIVTSCLMISIALFVAGWLDHRLLVRALGDGHMNGGAERSDARLR